VEIFDFFFHFFFFLVFETEFDAHALDKFPRHPAGNGGHAVEVKFDEGIIVKQGFAKKPGAATGKIIDDDVQLIAVLSFLAVLILVFGGSAHNLLKPFPVTWPGIRVNKTRRALALKNRYPLLRCVF